MNLLYLSGKKLEEKDKNEIKKISIQLLEELKKDKLKVEQWSDKSVTAAAVFNTISKTLFETLPYPTYHTDDIDLKTNLVFENCAVNPASLLINPNNVVCSL